MLAFLALAYWSTLSFSKIFLATIVSMADLTVLASKLSLAWARLIFLDLPSAALKLRSNFLKSLFDFCHCGVGSSLLV